MVKLAVRGCLWSFGANKKDGSKCDDGGCGDVVRYFRRRGDNHPLMVSLGVTGAPTDLALPA